MDRGEVSMAPELWGRLPSEMQDHLLSFLTVPVQCRFQTVCKRWDSLIRDAEFRALSNKHGNAQGYILGRVARPSPLHSRTAQFSRSLGWRLLDVEANRWYWIKHNDGDWFESFESRSLGIDNGLVCAFYADPMALFPRVCVSNPIATVMARLPASPYSSHPPTVDQLSNQRIPFLTAMVVDPDERFRVFVMCSTLHHAWAKQPTVVVYDSRTKSWVRSATNLMQRTGVTHSCYSRSPITVRCVTIFQGFLYALLSNPTTCDIDGFWQLWKWNPEDDEWNEVTSATKSFHLHFQIVYPQLVVSGNRLFIVSWISRSHVISFDVLEILMDNGHWRLLLRLPKPQMEAAFETDFRQRLGVVTEAPARYVTAYCFADSPDVTAFGFENAIILIARKSGVSRAIDLETWSFVEERPFARAPACDLQVWYGQPMRVIPHHDKNSQLRKRCDTDGVITLSDDSD